jgi:hypothetical protein
MRVKTSQNPQCSAHATELGDAFQSPSIVPCAPASFAHSLGFSASLLVAFTRIARRKSGGRTVAMRGSAQNVKGAE